MLGVAKYGNSSIALRKLIPISALFLAVLVTQSSVATEVEKYNFRWTQSITEDTSKSALVPQSKSKKLAAKREKRAEKFAADLQKHIASKVPATFFSNPPYTGSIHLTMELATDLAWRTGQPRPDDNRAARVAEAVVTRRDLPTDEDDKVDPRRPQSGKIKAVDYEVTMAVFKLCNLQDSAVCKVVLPAKDKSSVNTDELAKMVTVEIERYLASMGLARK